MKLSEKIRRWPHIVHQSTQHEWADEVEQLEADLAKTNRAMQAAIDAGVMAVAENDALSELLSALVDVELERDTLKAALSVAMNENQRLTKIIENSESDYENSAQ